MKNIIDAIDTNMFDFFKSPFLINAKIHYCEEDGWKFAKYNPSPWANAIYDLNIRSTQQLKRLCQYIENGIAPNHLHTGPTSFPVDIHDLLLKTGFKQRYNIAGMAMDMAYFKPVDYISSLDSTEVSTRSQLL